MFLKTCLITLSWFTCQTVYIGLSMIGPSMGSNQYLSFFLSSLVELPSYLVCYVLIDRWGRRWPFCISLMLGCDFSSASQSRGLVLIVFLCFFSSGISCISVVLVDQTDELLTLSLFLLSKFFIAAAFMALYPLAGEIYPTEVRGVGIATSSYIGGLGMIIIPFVTYLVRMILINYVKTNNHIVQLQGKENLQTPLIVMGCLTVISGVLGLRLPETLHYRLPQTLKEGEEFGRDWTCGDFMRCIPLKYMTFGTYLVGIE